MSHIIKLPDIIYNEFLRNLRKGEVTILGIGTIYVSQYKKKAHPSLVSNDGDMKYSNKPRKLTRINLRPSAELKAKL